MNRSKRAEIAAETLKILEEGGYQNRENSFVSIAESLTQAKENTILYQPEDFHEVFSTRDKLIPTLNYKTELQVINQTSLAAAENLVVRERKKKVLCLNFASAKNPGGGFLGGSQAQEESLARASGLYPCIAQMKEYYQAHKDSKSCFYSDRLIYSPSVPVFRDERDGLLTNPYSLSFVTAPAVNRGVIERREPEKIENISEVMGGRIEKLLSLCVIHQHPVLILGAWGCGVFQNNPAEIASLFREQLLENPLFKNAFEKVVFAVLDRKKDLKVFREFDKALIVDS